MEFAFVMAMGGVFLVDVGIATFQFFINAGFVYCTGTDVVGECAE